jgi:tryptophan synthase alpha chain
LKAGGSLEQTLELARGFRAHDKDTPLILMGYANPIEQMGYEAFAQGMRDAGADGAIVVDLPPEEDAPLRAAFAAHDLAVIRLATPTTDDNRLTKVLEGASGRRGYRRECCKHGRRADGSGAPQARDGFTHCRRVWRTRAGGGPRHRADRGRRGDRLCICG